MLATEPTPGRQGEAPQRRANPGAKATSPVSQDQVYPGLRGEIGRRQQMGQGPSGHVLRQAQSDTVSHDE